MSIKKVLFIFLLSILFAIPAKADDTLVFNRRQESRLIGKHVYIFKDESNTLDFNGIRNNSGFVKNENDVPNLGVSPYTFWLKFSIRNETSEDPLLLEFSQPFTNEVILYSTRNGKYDVQLSGDNYPFAFRRYKQPNFIFALHIKKNTTATFYLKVKSDEQLLVPLKLGARTVIINEAHNRDLIFGVYAGIMIVMMLYNLFIFFFVRDQIYLRYVIYTLFIALTQASILGYPFEFLWPNNPYFANISIDIFSCCVGISALEFLKPFLHTREFAPKLHKFSYVITGIYIVGLIITLSGFMNAAYLTIQANAVLVAFYMLTVAIVISRRGLKQAVFFLVAWSAMLVGIIIFVLKDFGFMPINMLTSYTMPIGSALETILLAIALAERINGLRKEKEESQAEALEVLQQNQKLVADQNIVLEQKVHERTLELEETNEELNVTLSYLKDTQAQLVDAEKMASLGQLTAGIAHEINNPINFVSANLKPLKMDVADILDVIKKYEDLNPNAPIEDQLKEINAFKQKIDIDYLKKEIGTLLNSIEDGARRTAEIVSGLKNFSRLDESEIKQANINEGIESTLVLLRSTVPDNVEIIADLGNIPYIECYPGKLNQVFMNLLSNALYAMKKKDGGKNTLVIRTYTKGEKVCVSVEDSGIGMTQQVKEKIFEPFFTTKDVGEGTGLGMSIVFKIVESHHAKMEIESEPGVGTKITLLLNKRIS